MQKEFVDNVNQASKQAFEAAKEITALNTSTFESIMDKQLEMANQFMALGTKQSQIAAEIKDVPSAFQAQSALFQELTEQGASNAREAVALANKTRDAYDKLFQKGLNDAGKAVKKAQADFTAA